MDLCGTLFYFYFVKEEVFQGVQNTSSIFLSCFFYLSGVGIWNYPDKNKNPKTEGKVAKHKRASLRQEVVAYEVEGRLGEKAEWGQGRGRALMSTVTVLKKSFWVRCRSRPLESWVLAQLSKAQKPASAQSAVNVIHPFCLGKEKNRALGWLANDAEKYLEKCLKLKYWDLPKSSR